MITFPFLYGLFILSAGGFSLLIGIFLYSRYHSGLGREYFFLATAIFITALAEAFFRLAPNPGVAHIWSTLSIIAWVLVFFSYIRFALLFAGERVKFWPLLFLIAGVFVWFYGTSNFFVSDYLRHYYGYDIEPGPGFVLIPFLVIFYISTGLYFLVKVFRTAEEYYRRRQAQVLILSTIIPLAVSLLFDQLFLVLGYDFLPLGIIAAAAVVGFVAVGVVRYAPVYGLTKAQIAEVAANTLSDPLFITDLQGAVDYANPAAVKLTGFQLPEIVGQKIDRLLVKEKGSVYNLKRKKKNLALVSLGVFKLTGERGYIYLTRDLTPAVELRKAVHKMSANNNIALRREKRIVEIIFDFTSAERPGDVEAIWQKVLADEPVAIREVIRPVYSLIKEYLELVAGVRRSRDEMAAKVAELEKVNRLMAGREEAYQELEKRYKELSEK